MANAETQQKLLDYYSNASAEMQQKMYNAGNAEVKAMIDTYNNQNATNTPNTQTVTSTTEVPTDRNGGVGGNGRPDQKGALTPETYNYYSNDTQEQQDKIVSNLYDYYQKTPNLFTNYQNFKNNFSYDARSDQQKKTLDDWWFGYDKSRQLNTKSIGDLTTLYGSGQLTDADLNNLRTFYPDKYNQVMNKINAQSDMNQYSEMLYGPEDTLDTSNVFNQLGNQFLNNLLNSSYSSNIDYFEQYQNELNSEEMRGWSDRLTDLDTEIKKIDTDLNTLYKDIEKRYEGTGASTAKIQAVYADEAYDLQIQRNSLALEQQSLATKYNSRLQEAQQNFSMRVQQHQLEMQERNQYMSELGFAMDLINFETNEEADERAWKNWTRQIDYQYGNIDSLDPVARRKAVDNSVSEILNKYSDIPMKRSKDQMIEDILELVDGGMSLGDALTQNIITPIRSKPEYTVWLNSKLGTNSPVSYYVDENGKLGISAGNVTKAIGTGGNNYSTIDLGNGYSVSVDPNKVITINGQGYRVTQLGGETKTSGLDLAPVKQGDNQEVQAFIGGQVTRYGTDKDGNRYVEILGDNGYVYRYNHLNDRNEELKNITANGGRIEAGTVIGHMGNTGHTMGATGVHLDLAVYDGKRATDPSVSPLNAADQARIFFSSVSAQGLGLGSVGLSNSEEMTEDQRRIYESVKYDLMDIYGKTYFNNPEGKKTALAIEEWVKAGMSGNEIKDMLREGTIDELLKSEPALYRVATQLYTSLYGAKQKADRNQLEQIEDFVSAGEWDSAYEYVLSEFISKDSQKMSNQTKQDIQAEKETIIGLQDMYDLYNEYLNQGGDYGLLKKWYLNASNNGVWSWEGDSRFNDITNRMQIIMQNYIFGKSGKTVTDFEHKVYEALFPGRNASTKRTKDQMNSLIGIFEDSVNGRYTTALGSSNMKNLNAWYKTKTGKDFKWRMLGNYYDDGDMFD